MSDIEEQTAAKIAQFIAFGKQLGKSDEEINDLLKKAKQNGQI